MLAAIVFALYAAISLIVTYPIVWNLGTALPGAYGDQAEYMWCIDTFWTALASGHTPFFTTRVLYPIGANLMYTTYGPFVSLFAWPFLGNLVAYLGVVVLLSPPLAAFGAYLVTCALTGDRGAAFVAGLVYGLSPTVVSFAESSHYYKLVAAALFPYGVLALVRFLETTRRGALIALSAVAWALFFTDYYVFIMYLLLVCVVGSFTWRRQHTRGIVLACLSNALLALAVLHWVLPPVEWSQLTGGGGITTHANANFADYLVPQPYSLLLGRFSGWASDSGRDVNYFLGWSLLPVALAGLVLGQPRRIVVALAAAGALLGVLACGPEIKIGAIKLLINQWTPWYWLVKVPPLGLLDLPRCFALGPALIIGLLVGIGLAGWRRRRLALALGLALFTIDYGQIGMPPSNFSEFPVPSIYRRLAAASDTRTLLELPSGVTESKGGFGLSNDTPQNNPQMYWQTVHRKPRVGAYFSRIPGSTYSWFEHEPIISDLFIMTGYDGGWNGRQVDTLPDYRPEVVEQFFRTFNLGYVILAPHRKQTQFDLEVQRLLAGRIAARDVEEDYVMYTLTRDR
jgi:hypothetical protein